MDPYLYAVTARRADSVSHVLKGNITGPTDVNVVVSKFTHIEIYILEPVGDENENERDLRLVLDAPIYGRVTTVNKCRLPGATIDSLVISTERHQFIVVTYDPQTNSLKTEIVDDVKDPSARDNDYEHMCIIHQGMHLAALHAYQGLLKIIGIGGNPKKYPNARKKRRLVEAVGVNLRLEELSILSIQFLLTDAEDSGKPVLGVLYQDAKANRHFKTYVVDLGRAELKEYTLMARNVEANAKMMIPVPKASGGGVMIVGEQTLTFVNPGGTMSVPIRPTVMQCWDMLDAEGTRYLLGDYTGQIWVVALTVENGQMKDVAIDPLGETSIPSAIAYLSHSYTFVGSHFGDSQLVQLSQQPNGRGNFVEVVRDFQNLAPITDFCVVDVEKQGQGQVVACCGGYKDGSLRVVRNGVGIEVLGSLNDVPDLTGIWSLRSSFDSKVDDALVLSFVGETRLQAKDEEGDLGPVEGADCGGFRVGESTLACGNIVGDRIVQVTSTTVLVLACKTWQLLFTWSPPNGMRIHHASINPTQVLLGLSEGHLAYLEPDGTGLQLKSQTKLEYEISCLNINPLESKSGHRADVAIVGLWTDMSIRTLELPSLNVIEKQILESGMIPRSVLSVTMGAADFIMAALGDGHLYIFQFDATNRRLGQKKKVSLASHPISLCAFKSNGNTCVFAASDRPTVIHLSNEKLLYSPVNLKEVTHMCAFSFDAEALALVTEGSLKVGTVEAIQKLHIKKIPLGEVARRITHQEQSGTFGILTMKTVQDESGLDEEERSFVKVLDDRTFEELDAHRFDTFESVESIISITFNDDDKEFYCVGTALVLPEEDEPTKGRITVFEVTPERKLRIVAQVETKGCVYCLATVSGRLLAGVNSQVQLYKWESSTDTTPPTLTLKSTHHGNTLVYALAVRGDFILVGDLMKSMNVLSFTRDEESIDLIARDAATNWMTAVAALDDDLYIGSDHNYNLFMVRKQSDAALEHERRRLVGCGWFHVGEQINRLRHGSLVMNIVDHEPIAKPLLVYCTAAGGLGILAAVDKKTHALLEGVQENMSAIVRRVGDLPHEKWRRFDDHRGHIRSSSNFLDGDLIEQYLDLPRELKEAVVKGTRTNSAGSVAATNMVDDEMLSPREGGALRRLDVGVEELVRIVEELSRVH
ncbi:DNA damage-binding protein 1a-like protein [Fimicolochytrium jonesii]|uniref:DNA damage-binding protein 1a-like protein n=1 Tax=Fimicolochytrium jonesii TaxID=1396493 RepID=UPI0022FE0199|nr:DNA damage-binding protein 1a-like protein [Fimicolochytrium jonesii]KAI8822007.1 DNA damage-binding protein 1a-like protein [Fimicolochytrium jonesii]